MFQLNKKLLPLATVDCYFRKWKKIVSTSQRISFYQLKNSLASTYIGDGVHYEEKLRTKENGFFWLENPFPIAGKKDFVKKNFHQTGKKIFLPRASERSRKKRLLLARKLISPSRNKLSVAGIFFKNFGFNQQKQNV